MYDTSQNTLLKTRKIELGLALVTAKVGAERHSERVEGAPMGGGKLPSPDLHSNEDVTNPSLIKTRVHMLRGGRSPRDEPHLACVGGRTPTIVLFANGGFKQ